MQIELDYQPKTQNDLLLNHLKAHGSITMFEAFTELGISHLPRRVMDLKEKGIKINCDKWLQVKKANGKSATVKKYTLGEL